MTDNELIKMAKAAANNAYTPYSHFNVGAAILTSGNKVFTGCNVENASYGAAICAERTAAVKAVSEGERHFIKIAIVSSSEEFTYPCGICRQFLSEFFDKDGVVILEDKQQGIKTEKFFNLIPSAFTGDNIK